jgi:hypothetical protein
LFVVHPRYVSLNGGSSVAWSARNQVAPDDEIYSEMTHDIALIKLVTPCHRH